MRIKGDHNSAILINSVPPERGREYIQKQVMVLDRALNNRIHNICPVIMSRHSPLLFLPFQGRLGGVNNV